MRQYMCTCLNCGGRNHLRFDEPYPQYGDEFIRFCNHCGTDTTQTMVLTKKIATQLRKLKAENEELSFILLHFQPLVKALFFLPSICEKTGIIFAYPQVNNNTVLRII